MEQDTLYLTYFVEKEIAPKKWRLLAGPFVDVEVPLDKINLIFGAEYLEGAPCGSLSPRGVPADIGQETLKAGFIPIRKETVLNDEGELKTISKEDAQYEVSSWGCILIKDHVFFTTAEDFTYLYSHELMAQLGEEWETLFPELKEFFDIAQSESCRARVLWGLT